MDRQSDKLKERGFARLDGEPFPAFEAGWVWLVGAGPGAPGLMSLLCYHALQSSDVVVYDALVNSSILDWVRPGTALEYAGKRGGKPSAQQRDISLRLVELALEGKRVLRLKGGDPFMFGRGGEECQHLIKAGIRFRIVPGITAGIGGLAYAGLPSTHRDTNHSVIFLTGHDASGKMPANVNWQAIATASPVIVMYMAVKNLAEIADALIAGGRDSTDPVTIVSHATLPQQSVAQTSLREARTFLASNDVATPAIVVVGHVAEWLAVLDWYKGELRETQLADGLVIAAPASGSGKTVITLALLRALRQHGMAVASAKIGPDYIDPRFHEAASGRACVNLDGWAMRRADLKGLAAAIGADATVTLIEGVMGLFDGPEEGRGSTADIAEDLDVPVILIVDCSHQAQSIAALVHGFKTHRPHLDVPAVILNRVAGTRHANILRRALAASGVTVLGAVPRDASLALPSRHLGLVQASEHADLARFLEQAVTGVAAHVDMTGLLALARPIEAVPTRPLLPPLGQHMAIANDAAFAFLYPHLLDGWRRQGAELSLFSPLANEPPDPRADAVFLPGGYPELHAERLSKAHFFLAGLRHAKERGQLIYGECGGYMVLGQALIAADGRAHGMADLLPVTTSFARRKLHLGYRRLEHDGALPLPKVLKGHEFHYSMIESQDEGTPLFHASDACARDLGPMGLRHNRVMGSYAHVIA